jgi:hypothetical protein
MNSSAASLHHLAQLVEEGQTDQVEGLFAPGARYHDLAYGTYHGPSAIAGFISSWYKRAEDIYWRFFDICQEQDLVYASYYMSYSLTSKRLQYARVEVVAMSKIRFQNGQIHDYTESLNLGTPLLQMGLPVSAMAAYLNRVSRRESAAISLVRERLGL